MPFRVKIEGDFASAKRGLEGFSVKFKKAFNASVRQSAVGARAWLQDAYMGRGKAGAFVAPIEPPSTLTLMKRAMGKAAGATTASPKSRSTKALVHTGDLAKSVVLEHSAGGTFIVKLESGSRSFTGANYNRLAGLLETGGSFSIEVTQRMQSFLMAMFREAGLLRNRELSKRAKKGNRRIFVHIPPRPIWSKFHDAVDAELRTGFTGGRFKELNPYVILKKMIAPELALLKVRV
jgi:hypothetical protein